MNQLAFYGYHGVFQEEQKLGQRFIVDLVLQLDLKEAGTSDELNATINYGEVYNRVRNIVEGESLKLLESVAEKVAIELLANYERLQECKVKVIKPDPPIPGHYQSVAIEITRSRQ